MRTTGTPTSITGTGRLCARAPALVAGSTFRCRHTRDVGSKIDRDETPGKAGANTSSDVELGSPVSQVRPGDGHDSPRNIASEKRRIRLCLARVGVTEVDTWKGSPRRVKLALGPGVCIPYGLTTYGTVVDSLSAVTSEAAFAPWDPVYFPAVMKKAPRSFNPRRIGINLKPARPAGQTTPRDGTNTQ